jgi:hypothetical protein
MELLEPVRARFSATNSLMIWRISSRMGWKPVVNIG